MAAEDPMLNDRSDWPVDLLNSVASENPSRRTP